MPYDHYLFDMPDMGAALEQIDEQKEELVVGFYINDASQVCLIVKREDERIEKTLKKLFEKKEDE